MSPVRRRPPRSPESGEPRSKFIPTQLERYMGEQSVDVRALIEQIAKALVDAPDEVLVEQIEGETTVFELTVAPDDIGKVIGRQGRVARALRALVGAAGIRAHKRFGLEIIE